MVHLVAGLVCAALGMLMIWLATRHRTAQAGLVRRSIPVVLSVVGVMAVLVGFRVAFAA